MRLYDASLPKELVSTFPFAGRFPDAIPAVEKATSLYADHAAHFLSPVEALRLLGEAAAAAKTPGLLLNVAVGGEIVEVSNQHYGPAAAILAPGPPRGMHDGFETRRARAAGASDFVVVKLAVAVRLSRISLDFAYFINNSPDRMSIELFDGSTWHMLMAETKVKQYRGNVLSLAVPLSMPRVVQVRVRCVPCGGFNRLICLATAAEIKHNLAKPKL